MALQKQMLSKYARPTLDQAFALAKQQPNSTERKTTPQDHHKLADLVKKQKEFLRTANE